MKKEKIINTILALAVVVLLGIFAFCVRVRPLVDKVVVLRTAGMTDGHVAGIEKALQSKRGVASVRVDADDGRVIVEYDSRKIGPEVIASTVAGPGYGSRIAQMLSVERFGAATRGAYGARVMATDCPGGCGKIKSSKEH